MMMVVQRYGLVLVQICCTITLYASDSDKRVSSFQKRPRFGGMLRKISDEKMAEEHFELYRKRAILDRPQISIQEQIHRLDGDIQYAYAQRASVDKQLASYHAKEAELRKTEEELLANIEKLKREKEIITRRMEGYDKELKKYQKAEDDELYSIMMSSGSSQLEHCLHRIAIMDERKDELGQEVGSLYFNISSLEKKREEWNKCSDEAHKKRAELVQIHMMCFDDGTRPLLDQFDELIDLSIATAYTCPTDIFTQLAIKTDDARECAWCFALLKVFQNEKYRYEQIMRRIQSRKRDCDEQEKCVLCDCFRIKRETVFSNPTYIFDQLAVKTNDARECGWCFALLKVFKDKKPLYQQILKHLQNKKRYCDEQEKCILCDCLNAKRAKVSSKIAKHCLQQLKHDKVYRACVDCGDSLLKKENLLKDRAFVDYVEQIIPDYIAFRLDYLELFHKYDVKLNIYSKFSSQRSQITDLLVCYSNHMDDLKDLLDDKSNLCYLKRSVRNMDDAYSAFDGFLTRKKLAERTTELLTQAQMQIERILSDLNAIFYESSSSSSGSSLSSSDD